MAVATVAWILASNNRKVLSIDWDFGKPTLNKYFGPFMENKVELGFIDYLWEYAKAARHLPPEKRQAYSAQPPEIERRRCNSDGKGQLDVILAGETKTSHIRSRYFSWAEFFDHLFGRHLLESLYTRFSEEYDFVLVDLPSGSVTIQSLLNIGRLSDNLVACFSYDSESIEQTMKIVSAVLSAQGEKPRVVPVSMMVEYMELQLFHKARSYAEQRSRALHAVVAPLEEVPHIPYYRYQNRRLPLGADGELQRSLLHLAKIISSATDLQWIDPWAKTAVTQQVGSEGKDEEQPALWDATPYEGGGQYIFISYARDEKDLMLFFIRDLVQLGFPIWWDEEIPGGVEWSAYLERKINEAKVLMVFVSTTSAASLYVAQEVSLAERLHKPILSIRLDGTDLREEIDSIVSKYQTLRSDSPTFHEDLAKAIRVLGLD
jgi:MinD-like ATPase involved in chromosome partitioning or flagellar assembly